MVNQSEHKRRSLFNLEGAIERLCTFKRGKEKISILMPCSYGGVAQLGEHLPCKQGVRSSILLISTNSNNFTHISHFFSVLRTDVRDDIEEKANCTQTCLNLKSI